MIAKAEKRAHKRKANNVSKPVVVKIVIEGDISTSNEIKATVTDTSEKGIGILMDRALAPGQTIIFVNRENIKDLPEKGVIIWTTETKEGHKAGVMYK